jgi:hypothetical protein
MRRAPGGIGMCLAHQLRYLATEWRCAHGSADCDTYRKQVNAHGNPSIFTKSVYHAIQVDNSSSAGHPFHQSSTGERRRRCTYACSASAMRMPSIYAYQDHWRADLSKIYGALDCKTTCKRARTPLNGGNAFRLLPSHYPSENAESLHHDHSTRGR